jgi:phosphate transport system substrate-binding protein
VKPSKRATFAGAAILGGAMLAGAAPALGASTGSGATFPQLAYKDWCQTSGICSYTGKGSTGGIRDFIAGTVDFAGSDAIMTDSQVADLAARRGGVKPLYFPTLLGAIVVPTNVSGVRSRLKLDGKVLGEVFSGGITRWNDRRIAALNKGVRLPAADITVCVRADGSGTSFGFTNYLAKVSPSFRAKVGGASQQPNWTAPKLVKQPGNPGVAQCISDNANSLGYVDLGDAGNAGLGPKIAAIGKFERVRVTVRRGGKRVTQTRTREVFTLPSPRSIAAAGNLRSFSLADPFKIQFNLVNSAAPGAYPITITTFILAYSDYSQAGKSGSLDDIRRFLDYAYSTGQGRLARYGFVQLPAPMIRAAKAQRALLRN